MNFYEHPSQKPPEPSPEAAYQLGHMMGYYIGVLDAIEVLEELGGPGGSGNYTKTIDRASAIESVRKLND